MGEEEQGGRQLRKLGYDGGFEGQRHWDEGGADVRISDNKKETQGKKKLENSEMFLGIWFCDQHSLPETEV